MIPMSFCFGINFIRSHWNSVEEGADTAGRAPPPRSDWRLVREVVVAETDAEAMDFAINGPMGQHYRNFYLPMLREAGAIKGLKHDVNDADSDVTVEYLARHCWSIGSEASVLEKLEELNYLAGGFGVLLANSYDHLDCSEQWRTSIEALHTRIVPRLTARLERPQAEAA